MTTTLLRQPAMTRTPVPGPYRFTRAEYHRLGDIGFFDDKRVELIRGEIHVMSPIGWPHTVGVNKTQEALRTVFTGLGWVQTQNPVVTDDSEPEPDVAAYRGKMLDYFDHPTPPDTLLIVEVSATSLVKDTTLKADFYAQEGITEYWVVDVDNRKLLVFRDPSPTGYLTKKSLADTESLSPLAVPSASIRVADLLP